MHRNISSLYPISRCSTANLLRYFMSLVQRKPTIHGYLQINTGTSTEKILILSGGAAPPTVRITFNTPNAKFSEEHTLHFEFFRYIDQSNISKSFEMKGIVIWKQLGHSLWIKC